MKQLNLVDVPTVRGYRTIELWEGDICSPPENVDGLVISAIGGSYAPTPKSVIGALSRTLQIDVRQLASRPTLSLDGLNTWMSFPLPQSPFGGIVCVNVPPGLSALDYVFRNVFLSLLVAERKFQKMEVIAMPVLAAGDHRSFRRNEAEVIGPLLRQAIEFLQQCLSVQKIMFIELSPARASALSQAMNQYLERAPVTLAGGELADAVRSELSDLLARATASDPAGAVIYEDMARLLLSSEAQSFELGSLGRRLAENVCNRILVPKKVGRPLFNMIDELAGLGVAPWILSYMHMLRVFGNDAVHDKAKGKRPPYLAEGDLIVCLFAICRVVEFWLGYSNARFNTPNSLRARRHGRND